MEYAPNGTYWPKNHVPVKDTRILWKDDITEVAKYCGPALNHDWTIGSGASILACMVGRELPQPFLVLPRTLPQWALDEGWTVDLLRRYEQANADKVTVYPKNGPAKRKK